MNEELKQEVEKIIKSTNIIFILIIAVSLVIASISVYSYKVDEENKIALQEQNKKLRIENQRLVDKNNDTINEFEKLRSTLDYINYEKAFIEALVNTTFYYETGHGKSVLWTEYNNPGGIKGWYSGEYLSYESQTHGLTHLESLLRDKYINTYGHDIISIRKAYDANYTEEQLQEFAHMFKLELETMLNNE